MTTLARTARATQWNLVRGFGLGGHYKIVSLLDEGGIGAVFKAHDVTLQRDVAIKIMHPQFAQRPDFQERFLQEARTAARLDYLASLS